MPNGQLPPGWSPDAPGWVPPPGMPTWSQAAGWGVAPSVPPAYPPGAGWAEVPPRPSFWEKWWESYKAPFLAIPKVAKGLVEEAQTKWGREAISRRAWEKWREAHEPAPEVPKWGLELLRGLPPPEAQKIPLELLAGLPTGFEARIDQAVSGFASEFVDTSPILYGKKAKENYAQTEQLRILNLILTGDKSYKGYTVFEIAGKKYPGGVVVTSENAKQIIADIQFNKLQYASEVAYGAAIIDEIGNRITRDDAKRMLIEDIEASGNLVTVLFALGGEDIEVMTMTLEDAIDWVYGKAEKGRGKIVPKTAEEQEAGLAEWRENRPEMVTARADWAEKAQAIIEGGGDYWTKTTLLNNIYNTYYSKGVLLGRETLKDWFNKAYESLSAEDKAAVEPYRTASGEIMGRASETEESRAAREQAKAEREREEAGRVNVNELSRELTAFGASILPNYPYLSPVTEAHLRMIPLNVLDMMRRYLEEKGIGWGDFMALGRGGAGQPAFEWGIPRQY